MEPPDGPDEHRCQSCGERLEPADRYCPSCGTPADRSGIGNGGWEQGTERPPEGQGAGGKAAVDSSPGLPGSLTGQESQLRTAGVAVGLGILGPVFLLVGTLLAGVVLGVLQVPQNLTLVLGTSMAQIFGFGGVALVYMRQRGYEWAQVRSYLGVRVPTLRELGVVIAGYVGIVVALIAISIAATLFLPDPAENQGAQQAIENPEIIPGMIVMMLLVVGPFEELLYRGVVQNRLRENFDVFPAIAIASAIFASVHVVALAGDLVGMLVTVTILFFPATIFGYVYEYTGNLVVPALLHGIHNSILLTLILLGPELEEGNAFLLQLVRAAGL